MSVYNSSSNFNEDDTDVTIINHSLLYDHNDGPISACLPVLRRSQQANQPSKVIPPANNRSKSNNNDDYVFVNRGLVESGKQIEQILDYYRKELRQESKTQVDCNRQLITRLVDFVRPLYSSDPKQMKQLDLLFEDISILHDKRFLEQKEKNDQLQDKIRHLRKSFIEDDSRDSLMANLYRINSIADYEQWAEMEEEARKLHNLVKTQRDQIEKLVELLSQREAMNNEQSTTTLKSEPASVDNNGKKCSLCHFEFPSTFTDDQIILHFEKCLTISNIDARSLATEPRQWACPYCSMKLPNADEMTYMEHVSKCCNDIADND